MESCMYITTTSYYSVMGQSVHWPHFQMRPERSGRMRPSAPASSSKPEHLAAFANSAGALRTNLQMRPMYSLSHDCITSLMVVMTDTLVFTMCLVLHVITARVYHRLSICNYNSLYSDISATTTV